MNNNNDTFEKMLRHTISIFISLETLLLCWFILKISISSDSMIKLKYHETLLGNVIFGPLFICILLVLFSVWSLKSRTGYYVFEGIHIGVGVICLLLFVAAGDLLVGLVTMLILSGRFIIYKIIMKAYEKSLLTSSKGESSGDSGKAGSDS